MFTNDPCGPGNEEFNVKKSTERTGNRNPSAFYGDTTFDSLWSLLTQTGRLFMGIAGASIEAARTFNTQLMYRLLHSEGYSDNYIKSLFETNADYHEHMARNAIQHRIATFQKTADFHQSIAEKFRNAADNLSYEKERRDNAFNEPIDYDLLAKKVAEELKKHQ